MTDTKNNALERIRVITDERQRVFRLEEFNLKLPSVGIFDEPKRCYSVNLQWAKLITGAVDLLCEIAVWQDANNEDYQGIRQIQEFLIGEDCMDCNDVENCLTTSPIILALQNDIINLQNADINLQNQIDSNDVDILALQNADNSLQSQITSNDVDILALQNADNNLQSQITSNDVDISALQLDAQQQALTINDHETRITTLENSGGGGGGSVIKTTNYTVEIPNEIIVSGVNYADVMTIQHDFTLPNVMMIFEFRARSSHNVYHARFRSKLGNEIGLSEAWTWSLNYQSIQLNHVFENILTGTQDIVLQASNENPAGDAKFLGEQLVQVAIFEYSEPAQPNTITVDYDSGYSYTLPSPNVGTVQSGGNPFNCLRNDAVASQDPSVGLYTQIDLGQVENIDGIQIDLHVSNPSQVYIRVFLDGSPLGGNTISGIQASIWETIDFETENIPFNINYPLVGQVLKIGIDNAGGIGGSAMAMRIDNIVVTLG